jgi:dUTP pyrophosphatase
MQVKIVNESNHPLPSFETALSAGMDLRAFIDRPVRLAPMARALVPTGLYIELPGGYEAQIRPRSGLAAKHGITVINAPGTVDADYRGEIRVALINLSDTDYEVQNGDRIAQMVVAPHARVEWVTAAELAGSERGTGGFGSTGK